MLKIFISVLLTNWFFLAVAHAQNPPTPPSLDKIERNWVTPLTHGEGYLLGRIQDAHNILWGIPKFGLNKETFEANIYLGGDSPAGPMYDRACMNSFELDIKSRNLSVSQQRAEMQQAKAKCEKGYMPWGVSSYDPNWYRELRPSPTNTRQNRLVMVHYREVHPHPLLSSPYLIQEVIPVRRDYRPEQVYMEFPEQFPGWFDPASVGFYEGRVVKAGIDGLGRRANQIIVQTSASSNEFAWLGVPNDELMQFIIRGMASGYMISVSYYETFPWQMQSWLNGLIRGYDNNAKVWAAKLYIDSTPNLPSETPAPPP